MEDYQDPKSMGENKLTVKAIDGQILKNMLEASMIWLRINQQVVNSLNVFPVPDGDTGTNMLLTMQSAFNEIVDSSESNIGKIAHAISQGALMGARGNSGVILSQIWRGFARALDSMDSMDCKTFVTALNESRNTAYKGVVRPVEGTILTVIKDIAAAADHACGNDNDLVDLLRTIVSAADESVRHTPELLPILKQAGVVDSGGKGLFFIFEGMLRFALGLSLEASEVTVQPLAALNLDASMDQIEPGQDYEVVIDFQPFENLNLENYFNELSKIGTSIQIGEGDRMYRMHIHVPTDNRNLPITQTMKVGNITNITTENLLEQMNKKSSRQNEEIPLSRVNQGQVALVVVSPGKGFSRVFASLGAAAIIEGGQTMNPSTEQILNAFEALPTDKVIILPNNKNIILAAQNTAHLTKKNVRIVTSKSVPQGLSAILRHDPDGDLEEQFQKMLSSIHDVETGEITTATRSVNINNVDVKEGEVIVLHNGDLILSTNDLQKACLHFLEASKAEEHERITLFYGQNVEKKTVDDIVESIKQRYPPPMHEIEVLEGGQLFYQFIISVE
jgi:DAK2 domain fusion protein YloV